MKRSQAKAYDRSYFDHWYRSRAAVVTPESLQRKVRLAVSAAELVLGRRIGSVLDIGCGEAAWRAPLRRMRPGLRYTGVDNSEYVLARYGRRRNIRAGSFGTVGRLGLTGGFDLIVCSDVLMYVSTPDLLRGLVSVRRLLRGVAYIEAFTTSDVVEGDLDGWHQRSEAAYRKAFRSAGLHACGLNCWVGPGQLHLLSALERRP